MRPKGNLTAEVTSEILSQEQGANIDEIELLREERFKFAKSYLDEVLEGRLEWLRAMAGRQRRKQSRFNMGLVLTSGTIIIMQMVSLITPPSSIFALYPSVMSSLLAIYALFYVVVVAEEPWRWKIYQIQAGKMESEYRRYVTMITPYSLGLGEARSRELFVENMEQIVKDI